METKDNKKSFYRVERWRNPAGLDPSNEENWFYYRSHTFETTEEVESYIKKHNSIYRLVVYKVEEEFVKQLEPTYEGCMNDEEYKKFLNDPLCQEEIEQIKKEWTD